MFAKHKEKWQTMSCICALGRVTFKGRTAFNYDLTMHDIESTLKGLIGYTRESKLEEELRRVEFADRNREAEYAGLD